MAIQAKPQTSTIGAKNLADAFIPPSLLHVRSSRGLARVFIITHLVGALVCIAVLAYLSRVVPATDIGLYFVAAMAAIFLGLPLLLRLTGNISLVTLTSFQSLMLLSLVGTFEYGGFASPFLPWLLVA